MCIHTCTVDMYIYIYVSMRARERERERQRKQSWRLVWLVSYFVVCFVSKDYRIQDDYPHIYIGSWTRMRFLTRGPPSTDSEHKSFWSLCWPHFFSCQSHTEKRVPPCVFVNTFIKTGGRTDICLEKNLTEYSSLTVFNIIILIDRHEYYQSWVVFLSPFVADSDTLPRGQESTLKFQQACPDATGRTSCPHQRSTAQYKADDDGGVFWDFQWTWVGSSPNW